ncbi:MAG TPA: hypothetical protein VJ499_17030 [Flavisolibacter sp.]|nr:hypothetical protein [Flavisolibacter sp.]
MKSLKYIATHERHHYMKCECGHFFDMRDLNDVVKHLHKMQSSIPENSYAHSVKIGEPKAYTRTKKKLDLN